MGLFATAQDEAPTRTPPRHWEATSGQKLEAVAIAYDGVTVTLMNRQRRELQLTIDKLVEADKVYLEEFFPPAAPPFDLGQVQGPFDAGSGSTYFAYISSTYNPRGGNPLVVHTASQGGNADLILPYQRALQTHGWCYISIVGSSWQAGIRDSSADTSRCLRHALKTLPVDKKQVFFVGAGAGGSQALYNLSKLRGAGAFVGAGHLPKEESVSLTRKDVVLAVPVLSPQRYSSSAIAKKVGKTALLIPHVDSGSMGRPPLVEDAFGWLQARYLMRSYTPDPIAIAAFEEKMLAWIETLKEFENYRAYYWARFMTTQWTPSEANKEALDAALAGLGEEASTVQFAQALDAINTWMVKHYAPLDEDQSARFSHTDPKLKAAVPALLEAYPDASDMTDVIQDLASRTSPKPPPKPGAE